MPTHLYRRGQIWWARAKIDGRDIRASLRTRHAGQAKSRLKKWLEEIDHLRFHGESRHTWNEAVGRWVLEFLPTLKPSTGDRYLSSLRQVEPFLKPKFVDQVDKKIIADIVSTRRLAGAINATIRRDLTAIASVLDSAASWGWVDEDQSNAALAYRFRNRRQLRERRDPIDLPDEADISAVVRRLPGNFAYLVRFAQYTGMRQEELGSLERRQVRHGVATLLKTKTNAPRAIQLDERALGTYQGTLLKKDCPYVFWHGKGERYLNIASRFAGKVKDAVAAGEAKPFRFHDLRHWYAVDYLRRGGSIYDLQQNLGHRSIKTTEIYLAFLTPEEKRVAMRVGTKGGTESNGSEAENTAQKDAK